MKIYLRKSMVVTLLCVVMLCACSDYLDVPLEGQLPTENFFTTEAHAEQSVVAIYASMRKWEMVAFAHLSVQEVPSDNNIKGGKQDDASFINAYNTFTMSASEGQLHDYWKGRYRGINLCNQTISNVPPIDMNANLKARLLGEAKFARAFFYFDLVRAFGDIPMPVSIENAQEASLVKTPKADVYAQIIQDLKDAIAVLPESYDAANAGRATQYSARGLLAKVYLYQEQWDNVLEQTSAIINSNRFHLMEDFYEVFRVRNENGPESIFEIQAAANPSINDFSSSQYSQVQGWAGFGWGFNAPSDDLANAFDAAGDEERKNATILYEGTTTPDGDKVTSTGPMEGVAVQRYNGKSYVPKADQVTGVNEGSAQNIRVLRYSEILLIDAEAKVRKGDVTGAAASLKVVRDRVGLPEIAAPTLQNIWDERRLELAMEGDRFFDLVRTGQAPTVLGPVGFVSGKNEVFPIPQQVIDVTDNLIKQNPNY